MRGKRGVALALAALLGILCLPVPAGAETVFLHEQSFSADHNMTGLFCGFSEAFYVGEGWEVQSASLVLCYSVTQLIRQSVSDFTLSLNGRRFYSQRFPVGDGQVQQMSVALPLDALLEGYNVLKLEAYVRTSDEEPCADDVSKASWMTVLKDSSVAVRYVPTAGCLSVADLYDRITSIEALENGQSAVFLPLSPSADELTGAAWALSGLAGSALFSYDALRLCRFGSDSLSDYPYAVYIAELGRLDASVRALLTQEQLQAAQEEAVLALAETSSGTHVLIVTSASGEALQNAGRLLANAVSMRQTKAAWRRVGVTEDVSFAWDAGAPEKLTQTGGYVSGAFRQEMTFGVAGFANRVVLEGSTVTIDCRYSENLDFDRSLLTVYIGDTPIGSRKLSRAGAAGETIAFEIPASMQLSGNFTLTAAFDLEIKDLECTLRQEETPWAYVTEESSLRLLTRRAEALLFENYPSPFLADGRFDSATLLLPDAFTDADLEVFRSLLLTLGRSLKDNGGALRAAFYSGMGELRRENVIAIGRLESNPIAQQLNNLLYFQFSPQGTTVRGNEKLGIEANYGATLGSGQLIASPYSDKGNALLLVSGVSDQAMLRAARYLGSVEKLWSVYGDGFVADEERAYSYRFGEDNALQDSASVRLWERPRALLLLSIGGGVFLLLAVAAVLLAVKHGKRR